MSRLTKEQANIITAYTGIMCTNMGDFQKYADEKLGTVTMTHDFASKELWKELKEKVKQDFIDICYAEGREVEG